LGFDAGDSNLYRYVNNQPTIATDPSGLISWTNIFGSDSYGNYLLLKLLQNGTGDGGTFTNPFGGGVMVVPPNFLVILQRESIIFELRRYIDLRLTTLLERIGQITEEQKTTIDRSIRLLTSVSYREREQATCDLLNSPIQTLTYIRSVYQTTQDLEQITRLAKVIEQLTKKAIVTMVSQVIFEGTTLQIIEGLGQIRQQNRWLWRYLPYPLQDIFTLYTIMQGLRPG
jgi:hypothetical protein